MPTKPDEAVTRDAKLLYERECEWSRVQFGTRGHRPWRLLAERVKAFWVFMATAKPKRRTAK